MTAPRCRTRVEDTKTRDRCLLVWLSNCADVGEDGFQLHALLGRPVVGVHRLVECNDIAGSSHVFQLKVKTAQPAHGGRHCDGKLRIARGSLEPIESRLISRYMNV